MKRVKKQTKAAPSKAKSARKQDPEIPDSESDNRDNASRVRFSATIHAPAKASPNWMEKLEVDRIPDPKGQVRALLTAADCVRLLDQGFEIHLHHAYPVQPLKPQLIESDESFRRSLEKELKKIKGFKQRKGFEDL